MIKIVFLDTKTVGDDVDLTIFNKYGKTAFYGTTTKEQTINRVKDANIIITNKVIIDKKVIDNSPNLKLICVAATGMNNVDLKYAASKNITVKNVAGYSTNSVVQHTFSMAFYLIEQLKYYDNYVKNGNWCKSEIFTNIDRAFFEIFGKTWGIIGLGEIGQKVAQIAASFGSNVIYYSTSGKNCNQNFKRVSLEELLKTSDIISIHAPLNEQTKNLINKNNLLYLKKNAVLLNLGRGGIINETDLAEFIDKSEILVGLDVLEKEPMDINSPFRLIKSDRLFISPHIAWTSKEARIKLINGICKNIESFLRKEE